MLPVGMLLAVLEPATVNTGCKLEYTTVLLPTIALLLTYKLATWKFAKNPGLISNTTSGIVPGFDESIVAVVLPLNVKNCAPKLLGLAGSPA